jgi:nitrile hydratase accessory protein
LSARETAATLPGQPSDETGPVFAEPWQAQAFALAIQLSEAGYFSWTEWAETLGTELRAAGEDDGSRYYETWLRALVRLSLSKGLTDAAALDARTAAWADAYRRTPHGQPVELLGI